MGAWEISSLLLAFLEKENFQVTVEVSFLYRKLHVW